jgi:RNA polymerase sigma factor (TIGR02999 family)
MENLVHEEFTRLLDRMKTGDTEAGNRAFALVDAELHRIAAREHDLQTTALIHEVFVRLFGAGPIGVTDRRFLPMASALVRRVLVESVRSQPTHLPRMQVELALDEPVIPTSSRSEQLLVLDEALSALEAIDRTAAKIVELKYFGGFTYEEIAEALGTNFAKVRRDWEFARSWLRDRLTPPATAVTTGPVKSLLIPALQRLSSHLLITDQDLARIFGVSTETIMSWKSGGAEIPREMETIISAADISLGRLLGIFRADRLPDVIRRKVELFRGRSALDLILEGRIEQVADSYDAAFAYQG